MGTSESTLSLITTSPSTLHLIYFSFSRLLDQINRFHLHPPHLCPGRSVHVRDNILDLSVILGFIQLPSTPANLTNSLQSAIMSVEIEPTELAFARPFTTEVSQSLKIRNSNRTPVAFKVKTTAPKQYCVRPNSGRIEPGKEVEVTVLLQAMKQDPPLDIKCAREEDPGCLPRSRKWSSCCYTHEEWRKWF